jgi:hypothetical protein
MLSQTSLWAHVINSSDNIIYSINDLQNLSKSNFNNEYSSSIINNNSYNKNSYQSSGTVGSNNDLMKQSQEDMVFLEFEQEKQKELLRFEQEDYEYNLFN